MSTAQSAPTACELKAPKLDVRPRVVSVNGIVIPRGDIAREAQNHSAATPVGAWKAAAQALVIRELLRQEAERCAIVAEPLTDDEGRRETIEEAAMRALIDRDVIVPSADEETCQRYYNQHGAKFRSAPLYAARHILLPAAPGDIPARKAARALAEELRDLLVERPELFPALAGTHSACPSAKVGGNLGQIGPGQTVPEFEKALAMMSPDGAPALVETRYGLHIVALDKKVEGTAIPFEMVRDRIADYLEDTVRRRAMQQYVTILAARAVIVGVELIPSSPPNSQ
jgi:peptidyl-prolyl cis-trans isomerase C